MRAGHATGGTNSAYALALLNLLSNLNGDVIHMQICAEQTLAVVQKNGVAIKKVIPSADDDS